MDINEKFITFDKVLLYNDDQCTDYITIPNPVTNEDWFDKTVRDVTKTWYFNKFRDAVYAVGKMFDTSKEPDPSIVDQSKLDWFDRDVITGKYVIVRLKSLNNQFDNGSGGLKQYLKVLNDINVFATISKR